MQLEHIDISNAFTQADIDDVDIFVSPWKGFTGPKGTVLKLKKALYGTMQASRLFQMAMRKKLIDLKFKPCASDPCLFSLKTPHGTIIIGCYVDDLIVLHDNEKLFDQFKGQFLNPATGGFKAMRVTHRALPQ